MQLKPKSEAEYKAKLLRALVAKDAMIYQNCFAWIMRYRQEHTAETVLGSR